MPFCSKPSLTGQTHTMTNQSMFAGQWFNVGANPDEEFSPKLEFAYGVTYQRCPSFAIFTHAVVRQAPKSALLYRPFSHLSPRAIINVLLSQ